MFRPHLPEAEIEEEIENSPLLAMLETEGQRIKDEAQTMESTPHLMFEITNSSGFSVQADSLNSKISPSGFLTLDFLTALFLNNVEFDVFFIIGE